MKNDTKDIILLLMITLFLFGLIGTMVYSTYKDVHRPICESKDVIDKKLCSNIGSDVWVCNMQKINVEQSSPSPRLTPSDNSEEKA